MATAIVWDDDPAVEPSPAPTVAELTELSKPFKAPTTVKEVLAWADINDLIAELNKRGMVVSAAPTSYYMPATVTTPITSPTITTTSGAFTMPNSYQVYTQLIGTAASSSLQAQAQLMQNVATIGRSTTGK